MKYSRLLVLLLVLFSAPLSGEILKPDSDERMYRPLELENGLTVLLISDPEAEAAGAAMTVAVGSDQDPDAIPGLAHLLEHMVFAGSERYPDRGGFHHYVSRQGGMFNGYTASDHTSFHFQVRPGGLDEALDRFADFLIAPSLAPEDLDQEIQIIQHEFEGASGDQNWEEMSVFRQLVNAEHPFAGFAMGNRASFELVEREVLLEELNRFFEDYYLAGDMKLVVLGSEPVNELEDRVTALFESLPAGETRHDQPPALFEDDDLPLDVRLGGKGEMERLVVSFPVDPAYLTHEVLPYRYISELIASRQGNRLRSELRDRGWISELAVSTRLQARDYASFEIFLPLTSEGRKHRDEVLGAVFSYLETIREEGVTSREYSEQQRSAREQFHNAEREFTMRYLSRLAAVLQQYPPEEVLSGPALMERFDAERIQAALDHMRPENAVVMDYQPQTEFAEDDIYSDATFELSSVTESRFARWQSPETEFAFRLEAPDNPWIVEEHEVVARNATSPAPRRLDGGDLGDISGFDVWFKQDAHFESPRGAVYLALEHPVAFSDLEGTVSAGIYALMLQEALETLAEQGSEAGLDMGVQRTDHGLGVSFYGFTGRQAEFIEQVLERTRSLEITPAMMRNAKAAYRLEGDQYRNMQPLQQLIVSLMLDANPVDASPEEKIGIAETLTREDLEDFHRRFWRQPQVTALIYGNYSSSDAEQVASRLQPALGGDFSTLQTEPQPIVELDDGLAERSLDLNDTDATVVYARRPTDVEETGPLLLLTQMLNERLFHSVRDQQAMGYQAFATLIMDYEHRGIAYGVQAPGETPQAIRDLIDTEVQSFVDGLESLEDDAFEQYREGVQSQLRQNRDSLGARSGFWWMSLQTYGKPFDEERIASEALRNLTPDALAAMARELFLEDDAQRLARLTHEEQ